ncbi:MAG: FecR domain-containing protein [Verrucomicrobiota bacterium]
MKYVGRFIRNVVPYGAALLITTLVVSANAQTQQGEAKVYGLKGSADYSDGGGTWMPLRVGKVLRAGSLIRTAAESQVDLNLKRNGPTVRVTENTTMGLDKLLFEMTGADVVIETRLDLQKGRIQGKVNKTSDASKYEVKTPRLVAGIRGTEYDITADGMVVVKSGTVSVAFIKSDGTQLNFTVNAKQTFDPAIPGVRGATPDELKWKPTVVVDERFMIVYEPGKEPYVSPISGKGTSGTSE